MTSLNVVGAGKSHSRYVALLNPLPDSGQVRIAVIRDDQIAVGALDFGDEAQ